MLVFILLNHTQKKVSIKEDDNMLTLGTRLCTYGASMMLEVLNDIERNKHVKRYRQNSKLVTLAPKIQKEMTIIKIIFLIMDLIKLR